MSKFIMDLTDEINEDEADQLFDEAFEAHSMCGRWRNGRLVRDCMQAGTEDCQFCPYSRADTKATRP